MNWKTKEKESPLAELGRLAAIETERRQWCISQATMLDETRPENLIKLAEAIYSYVYGERP